jgi:hypothetical protein
MTKGQEKKCILPKQTSMRWCSDKIEKLLKLDEACKFQHQRGTYRRLSSFTAGEQALLVSDADVAPPKNIEAACA